MAVSTTSNQNDFKGTIQSTESQRIVFGCIRKLKAHSKNDLLDSEVGRRTRSAPQRLDDQPIRASGAVAEYASLRSHPLEDGRTPQLEEESFIPFVGGPLTLHLPETPMLDYSNEDADSKAWNPCPVSRETALDLCMTKFGRGIVAPVNLRFLQLDGQQLLGSAGLLFVIGDSIRHSMISQRA